MCFVTLSNFKDVLNAQVAFNGVTGAIFSEKKQAIFANACDMHGYARNVWATANQWDDLGLSIKGAKGKSVSVKVFISANGATAQEKSDYEKALRAYLKIKDHNDKADQKGARKQFNPYIKTKGGIIFNAYYFNIEECRYKDADNTAPVDLTIPEQLKTASNVSALMLELSNKSEVCDLVEYVEPETVEVVDAEIIEDNTAPAQDERDQLIAQLKAENESLRKQIDALKAVTSQALKNVASEFSKVAQACK